MQVTDKKTRRWRRILVEDESDSEDNKQCKDPYQPSTSKALNEDHSDRVFFSTSDFGSGATREKLTSRGESESRKTEHQRRKNHLKLDTFVRRRKIDCPLCGKTLINVPRHMREVHDAPENLSRHALLFFHLRKVPKQPKRLHKTELKNQKDYHHSAPCPVVGCKAIVKRISRHLSTFHKLTKKQQAEKYSVLMTQTAGQERKNDSDDGASSGTEEIDLNVKPLTQVFDKFRLYLSSPMGAQLSGITIGQHISQIKKILKSMGTRNYRRLFDAVALNYTLGKMKKSENNENGVKNRTLRNYISSTKHFANFFDNHPNYDTYFQYTDLKKISSQLSNISCSMKRGCQKEAWEKHERDSEVIPKTTDIREYNNSKLKHSVVSELNEVERTQKYDPAVSSSNRIVGFLCLEVSVDNANRAEEIRLFTVNEWKKAKVDAQGGRVVNIASHKTYYKYGSQTLYVRPETVKYVEIYLNVIRPKLATKDSPDNLFLTPRGCAVTSSGLPKAMQMVWAASGRTTTMGNTALRKCTVTNVLEKCPEARPRLAKKMNHSEQTQQKYYWTIDKEKNAVAVSHEIRSILSSKETDKIDQNPDAGPSNLSTSTNEDEPVTRKGCNDSHPLMDNVALTLHLESDETSDDPYAVDCDGTSTSNKEKKSTETSTVTREEVDAVIMPDRTCRVEPSGGIMAGSMNSDHCTTNARWTSDLENSPLKKRSNKLNEFTTSQENYLKKTFNSMLQPSGTISVLILQKELNKTAEGRDIRDQFGNIKIRNKLKYFKYKCNK